MNSQIYLITGNDRLLCQRAAKEKIQHYQADTGAAVIPEIYQANDKQSPEAVLETCLLSLYTPPFLDDQKILWLQDFLELIALCSVETAKKIKAKLIDSIQRGLPKNILFIVDAVTLESKDPLYKICRKHADIIHEDKPEFNHKTGVKELYSFIQSCSKKIGISLNPPIFNYLSESIGADTGRLFQELEKIYCFAGKSPTLKQVQSISTGTREAFAFAFSNAVAQRNLAASLRTIRQSLSHSKEKDKTIRYLLYQAVRTFQNLLHAKLLWTYLKPATPHAFYSSIQQLNPAEKRRFQHNVLIKMKAGQIYALANQAKNYSGQELLERIALCTEIDKALVSSQSEKSILLEQLLIRTLSAKRN